MNGLQEKEYEYFTENKHGVFFHQSREWAELKKKNGWECERAVLKDSDSRTAASIQVLIKPIKLFGITVFSIAYAPRGPVFSAQYDNKTIEELTALIYEKLKRYRTGVLICDPPIEEGDVKIGEFISAGYVHTANAPDFSTIQFRGTMRIEHLLSKSEYELLKSFKQKARYNINIAIKSGVECFYSGEYLDEFYRLYQITAERDGLEIRTKQYYKDILDIFGENARLYVCLYADKILSAAICLHYSDTTYYLFGASDNIYRHVMPNYLMQWNMMLWALENGSDTYDFMGTPVSEDENAQMSGVYRFKKGFNGRKVVYAGEFIKVFKPFSWFMIQCALKTKSILRKSIKLISKIVD